MGIRNLGLLNIILNTLAIFTFFALYTAHRPGTQQHYAALAMIISFLGIGVFFANNRAFPMLDLSNQYIAATTDAQRAILQAAGQTMLSVGQSHTPSTFLGFFLLEIAEIMISVVMLKAKIFSKISAYLGILGFGMLLVFEFLTSFISGLNDVTTIFGMLSGFLSMAWYILIARRFFQLSRSPSKKEDQAIGWYRKILS
ncbi:MAG: hypothetical protein MUO76_13230 [Anaerolineaceae bacterium]|nr:hypothetical protein [Anaerolineaceae bacterium]